MQVIVLGATGLTGGHLIQYLVEDTSITEIKVFTRRSIGFEHPKIKEYIVDLLDWEKEATHFTADVLYCCIGTTKAKTPDKVLYRAIDYGIPVKAAQLAKKNGIKRFIVISSLGANEQSKVFYSRLKGEMERDVMKQNIEHTYILRPSLIYGNRNEKRLGEQVATQLMSVFNFIIPARYQRIKAKTIAKAMLQLTHTNYSKNIILSDKIKEIVTK